MKIWWERGRDCKCTDFIQGAATAMTPKKTANRDKPNKASTSKGGTKERLIFINKMPGQTPSIASPSQGTERAWWQNPQDKPFSPALQRGQPQARKMPCQKDGTRTQRTTSLDTGDTISPMHHASIAKMKPGSYHVGNLPRNRCDWSGWLLGANVTDLFDAENTIPNLQNGNGLLSVQLIQKYSPKSQTIFTKLAKPDVSTFTWKLSKEHYGCYSSVPWPVNVGRWAPACSCGWHLRSRFKTRQPWTDEPAPSQASQGRFCSTKIIRGVCGRQVALSLVRKPKDVKNSMRIATLISVHRPPKV